MERAFLISIVLHTGTQCHGHSLHENDERLKSEPCSGFTASRTGSGNVERVSSMFRCCRKEYALDQPARADKADLQHPYKWRSYRPQRIMRNEHLSETEMSSK